MGDHSTDIEKTGKFAIANDLYDVLNDLVKLGLPGLGAFYFTIATIWKLGYAEQVVGTLAAIAVVLGIFLAISKKSYLNSDKSNDGTLVVDTSNPLKDSYLLDVTAPLEDLPGRDSITLKIKAPSQ